uniref:Uncharacterized protein n=1 Tax=Rhodopseudomonas palustris (strain DX-1) TaxID=652103 RepID=E6VMI7_RHOPX
MVKVPAMQDHAARERREWAMTEATLRRTDAVIGMQRVDA